MSMTGTYAEVYARARSHPDDFWAEAAEEVHWFKQWDTVLDDSRKPFYRWFTGGQLNTCYNADVRHGALAHSGGLRSGAPNE